MCSMVMPLCVDFEFWIINIADIKSIGKSKDRIYDEWKYKIFVNFPQIKAIGAEK